MKNRRRTRRGRAKRWIYNGFGCWFHIRRSGNATFVAASRGEWVLDDAKTQVSHPSRTSAMRAAEHIARAAKWKPSRRAKPLGFGQWGGWLDVPPTPAMTAWVESEWHRMNRDDG